MTLFIEAQDTKGTSHTGEFLSEDACRVMNDNPDVKWAGMCTDNTMANKNMWKRMGELHKNKFFYGCVCHGFHLLVKDIIAKEPNSRSSWRPRRRRVWMIVNMYWFLISWWSFKYVNIFKLPLLFYFKLSTTKLLWPLREINHCLPIFMRVLPPYLVILTGISDIKGTKCHVITLKHNIHTCSIQIRPKLGASDALNCLK